MSPLTEKITRRIAKPPEGERVINIVHLYRNEMNIYGDRGNVLTLVKRLQWRGYNPKVTDVAVGEEFDFTKADIVFAGGGQDRGQLTVGEDLQKRAQSLHKAAADGVVMLVVCGTYQLFGRFFKTSEGQTIPGIGIFAAKTYGSDTRMIGNIIVDSPAGQLVGFENHSGQTELLDGQLSIGTVLKGYGNNEHSKEEGAVTGNVFGTYLHGPVLPKNPKFADLLIATAIKRKDPSFTALTPLDDSLEQRAAEVAKNRPQ